MSGSGDGSCLIQTLDAAYETNPDCYHNCQVDHCDLCDTPLPTWVKNIHKGCCQKLCDSSIRRTQKKEMNRTNEFIKGS